MIINITNVTDEIINISELSITLMPNITIDLFDTIEIYDIQKCESLFMMIANSKVIVNNGVDNLNSIRAYKYIMNESLSPTDRSGRPRFHQTSRPEGVTTCWMGVGDDMSNPSQGFGSGTPAIVNHQIGMHDDPVYLDFMTINNATYIHEGDITYSNCMFDRISCHIVPTLVNYTSGTNTNYKSYNGIIISTDGDGDIELNPNLINQPDGGLIQVKYDETGRKISAGFWDANWNNDTLQFDNITSAPDGSGDFNLFYYEMVFSTFVIDHLIGSGSESYQSSDVDRLWHGMRIKLVTQTCGFDWVHDDIVDHDWQLCVRYTLHRQKVI